MLSLCPLCLNQLQIPSRSEASQCFWIWAATVLIWKMLFLPPFGIFFFSLRMNAVWIQLKDNLKICQLLVSEKGNVSLQILNTGKKLKQNTIHLFIRDLSSSAFKLVVPIFPFFSPVSFYFSFVSFCFPMALYSILTQGQSEFRRH